MSVTQTSSQDFGADCRQVFPASQSEQDRPRRGEAEAVSLCS
jgi:hypothetical protein